MHTVMHGDLGPDEVDDAPERIRVPTLLKL